MARGLKAHPVENALIDFHIVRKELIGEFLADDGVMCETETRILVGFDEAVGVVAHDRFLGRAMAHIERQPRGTVTDYTIDQFRRAGLKIAPLESEDEAA